MDQMDSWPPSVNSWWHKELQKERRLRERRKSREMEFNGPEKRQGERRQGRAKPGGHRGKVFSKAQVDRELRGEK
jgi:hypothetical protein